jgi:hypothetical protein
LSDDGREWRTVRAVAESDGGSDPLLLTESEARYLRLRLIAGPGPAYVLNEFEVKDLAFGADPNAFISALAREAPRGTFPRGYSEQPYWTLVGVDGGTNSGLMGEDGAVEIGKGGPSIEPFVIDGYRLTSWADAHARQLLRNDHLPIPTGALGSGGLAAGNHLLCRWRCLRGSAGHALHAHQHRQDPAQAEACAGGAPVSG